DETASIDSRRTRPVFKCEGSPPDASSGERGSARLPLPTRGLAPVVRKLWLDLAHERPLDDQRDGSRLHVRVRLVRRLLVRALRHQTDGRRYARIGLAPGLSAIPSAVSSAALAAPACRPPHG